MPITNAQRKAAYKYKAANIKRVPLDIQNNEYDALKAAADSVGMAVNAFIKAAIREKMEQAAPWVSVTDRLPEGGEVLVYDPEVREVTVAFFESGRWIGRGYNEEHTVTHWQPLPAPPTVSGTPDSDTADGA